MNLNFKDFDTLDKLLLGFLGFLLVSFVLPIILNLLSNGEIKTAMWIFIACAFVFSIVLIFFIVKQKKKDTTNNDEGVTCKQATGLYTQLKKIHLFIETENIDIDTIIKYTKSYRNISKDMSEEDIIDILNSYRDRPDIYEHSLLKIQREELENNIEKIKIDYIKPALKHILQIVIDNYITFIIQYTSIFEKESKHISYSEVNRLIYKIFREIKTYLSNCDFTDEQKERINYKYDIMHNSFKDRVMNIFFDNYFYTDYIRISVLFNFTYGKLKDFIDELSR